MRRENHFKGVNSIKFHSPFSNDETCLAYLAVLKWNETNRNGYKPLEKEFPDLDQVKPDRGTGLPETYIHIINLKDGLE